MSGGSASKGGGHASRSPCQRTTQSENEPGREADAVRELRKLGIGMAGGALLQDGDQGEHELNGESQLQQDGVRA